MLQESDRHTQSEVPSPLPIGKTQDVHVEMSHHVEFFIKLTLPRDNRNHNSELFFRQTQEVIGCLQFWVFIQS
jgi:hypothetical protein